jgi:hypothetical protein
VANVVSRMGAPGRLVCASWALPIADKLSAEQQNLYNKHAAIVAR